MTSLFDGATLNTCSKQCARDRRIFRTACRGGGTQMGLRLSFTPRHPRSRYECRPGSQDLISPDTVMSAPRSQIREELMPGNRFSMKLLRQTIPLSAVGKGPHLLKLIGWNIVVRVLARTTVIRTLFAVGLKTLIPTPNHLHHYSQSLRSPPPETACCHWRAI